MRRLILIRHPATPMSGTFCGHTDPDLSPIGEGQLERLCHRLRRTRIDRVISSDLKRAHRCADALAREHSLTAQRSPALREIHFGAWEGLLWSQIETQYAEAARRWMQTFPEDTAPGGEPYAHFIRRVGEEAIRWLRDPAWESIAVITHAGVLQHLLQSHCALDFASAWRMSARPATAIFCRARKSGSFEAREVWSAGSEGVL